MGCHEACGDQPAVPWSLLLSPARCCPWERVLLPAFLVPPFPCSSSLLLPLPKTWVFHSHQAKQSSVEVRLGASDRFTFSPVTLIRPSI